MSLKELRSFITSGLLGFVCGLGLAFFSFLDQTQITNLLLRSPSPSPHETASGSSRREGARPVKNIQKSSPSAAGTHVVEICVSDIESLHEAVRGGANSIEVCSNRIEGGTTPSIGLIEECVSYLQSTDIPVHVLIRPRAGDFSYSEREFECCLRDILAAKAARADGIVIGLLKQSGHVDAERMAIVRHVMGDDMSLTFHRAFDVCRLGKESTYVTCKDAKGKEKEEEKEEDVEHEGGGGGEGEEEEEDKDATKVAAAIASSSNAAHDDASDGALLLRQTIDVLIHLNCDRLLTSGRAASALRGVSVLKSVNDYLLACTSVSTSLPRPLVVVAAAGVGATNVASIIEQSGVRAVHAGSSICTRKARPNSTVAGGSAAGAAVEAGGGSIGVVNMGLTKSGGDSSTSDVFAWDIVDRVAVGVLVHAAGKAWQLTGIELEEEVCDEDQQHHEHQQQQQESYAALGDDGDTIEELNVDFPPTPPPTPPPLSTSPPPLPQISPSSSSSSISASSALGGSFVLL